MHQPLFEAPVYYFDCNETGVSEVHETMHCGRSALANLEITRQGFTLSRHRSSVSDWDDLDEINRIHRPEIRTLAKNIAHCDEVVVYPALARSTSEGLRRWMPAIPTIASATPRVRSRVDTIAAYVT